MVFGCRGSGCQVPGNRAADVRGQMCGLTMVPSATQVTSHLPLITQWCHPIHHLTAVIVCFHDNTHVLPAGDQMMSPFRNPLKLKGLPLSWHNYHIQGFISDFFHALPFRVLRYLTHVCNMNPVACKNMSDFTHAVLNEAQILIDIMNIMLVQQKVRICKIMHTMTQ